MAGISDGWAVLADRAAGRIVARSISYLRCYEYADRIKRDATARSTEAIWTKNIRRVLGDKDHITTHTIAM